MYKNKNVLLIAGGGTLGTHTAKELLRLGCSVDIICPEEKKSYDERLKFYQTYATDDFLKDLLAKKHYDGIVNFIHYDDAEDYKPVHKLLADKTEQLIFVSSYRVYADLQHPITEEAPRLLDVSTDEEFLAKEDYALSKARAEDFIRNESGTRNWTIIRPVISFSEKRLDIVTIGQRNVVVSGKTGRTVFLPQAAKNVTAGLDWAGNSGKLIANLMFKKEALGETFTISTAPNLTWGEVAQIYTELTGVKFEWMDTDEWLNDPDCVKNGYCRAASEDGRTGEEIGLSKIIPEEITGYYWAAVYDRFFDRRIDCSKVLRVTGLAKEDFLSIKEGIKTELSKIDMEEIK